jgi:molybdenum cofactor cytidylyltransferase
LRSNYKKSYILDERIAIIILAAGASSRLNRPKQLLDFRGKTLIEHAVNTALDANIGPVFVVLGNAREETADKLKSYGNKITVLINEEWKEGISSSIKKGLTEVENSNKDIYGVLVTLVDQPLITVTHLINMVKSHFTFGKNIIASGYGGSFGAPTFFHKSLFNYIEKLDGDRGAKSIISKLKRDVHIIPNPDAELDIDTAEDYKDLLNRS